MKWLCAVALIVSAVAGSSIEAAPSAAIPARLAPHLTQDGFEPGEYAWMEIYFLPRNSPERVSLDRWLNDRRLRATRTANDDLRTTGPLRQALSEGCFADIQCHWVEQGGKLADQFASYDEFKQELVRVAPYFQAYRYAVANVEATVARPATAPLSERLSSMVVGEQTLSGVFGMDPARPDLPLSKRQLAIFRTLIGFEGLKRSWRNADALARIIAEQGWPKLADVGAAGAQAALLIAQHADHNPGFQVKALAAMKPLAEKGEVPLKLYAYLYDRISVKTIGKQKYGTQFTCQGGQYRPAPLEDDQQVDRLRREAGMPTLVDYAKMLPPSC